ncbi:hypothetical protein JCM1840_006651 [Sporobolomyces johnsonii]
MFQRVAYLPRSPASHAATSPDSSASPHPQPLPQLGTLLYHGPVPPTTGLWYGIEWDDPSRGKHDGVHEKSGTRYFQTRVKGAGSFLRPDAPGLDTNGKSFKRAFYVKYLEEDLDLLAPPAVTSSTGSTAPLPSRDGEGETTSEFYSTESNFQVEVVLSNKVALRFRQLGRLREVGLEWEGVSRAWDEDQGGGQAELEELGAQLSRLEVLNLSYSMLPTLGEAERIANALPRLTTLIINSNRFQPVSSPTPLPGFERLTTLQLNNTLISWPEILVVAPSLANLVELQIGFNRIQTLSSSPPSADEAHLSLREPPPLPKLELLNLESNELSNWSELVSELSVLPSLTTLVLTSNHFSSLALPPPPASPSLAPSAPTPALTKLRHLSLTSNLLSSWADSIEALASSCETSFPKLSSLRVAGNPLTGASSRDCSTDPALSPDSPSTGDRTAVHTRLLTLARMPSLLELEGTAVPRAERDDAERFWLGRLAQGEEDERGLSEWARARVARLRAKHTDLVPAPNGLASKSVPSTSQKSTLKDRLIRLQVHLDPSLPSPAQPLELSVLPTLRTLLLRSQIARLVGRPLPKGKWRLVALLRPAEGESRPVRVEIPTGEEGREVGWWGFGGEGDTVAVEASV